MIKGKQVYLLYHSKYKVKYKAYKDLLKLHVVKVDGNFRITCNIEFAIDGINPGNNVIFTVHYIGWRLWHGGV